MLLQYILIALHVTECHEASRNMSRNIRKQWKEEDTEKAIIAVREKKMGTEIILLYFYISYSFVHKFISC
jgi:hypothetical protein